MSPRSGPGERRSPLGFAAVLVIVYAVFALSASARAAVQITRDFETAPVAYSLSLVAALTYILATLLLARSGGRSRAVLAVVIFELLGVLGVGTLTLVDPALFPESSVWSLYGIGYGFIPLLLPVLALVYLLRRRRGDPLAGARKATVTGD